LLWRRHVTVETALTERRYKSILKSGQTDFSRSTFFLPARSFSPAGLENFMARLLIITEGLGKQALELRLGLNHVGRNPDCEVHLPHSTVSSHHAELSLSADGVHLRDCGSTNGTFLNGKPVTEAWLAPGQQLRFGDVELSVESTDANIAIPNIEVEAPKAVAIEQDGKFYCVRHPERQVTFKCTHCSEMMCNACIHVMKLKGGQPHYLCRVCHHHCERLVVVRPKEKKGFFGFLQDTVRFKFGNPRDKEKK
jgi:hypothetical protein